jgi:hypothetical protein
MSASDQPKAVAAALAHVRAWSNHDFDDARAGLAPGVEVTAVTTRATWPPTALSGIDAYMRGLQEFAGAVVPGSLEVLAAVGDDHNALLTVTVDVDFGAGSVALPGARLYRVDDDGMIQVEHVVFYAAAP